MSDRSDVTLGLICRYQKKLDKYAQTGENEKIIYCIHKLKYLPVTVNHLEVTGVGKSINCLRHMQGEVGEKAKALVQKWKQMVSAEEQEEQRQELHRQKGFHEEQVTEPSYNEEFDVDEDSDENNCLQIEEKNYNPGGGDCDTEEDNYNGYDPRTSREDYLSVGINSENHSTYNPLGKADEEYCSHSINSVSLIHNNKDQLCNEESKHEEKHGKKKHRKSKSHHSSSSNSKSHKNKRDKDKLSSKKNVELKDNLKEHDRHKHKHKSSTPDPNRNLNPSTHSTHSRHCENNFAKPCFSESHQKFDIEQSVSINSSSHSDKEINLKLSHHHLSDKNNCNNNNIGKVTDKSYSCSSSKKSSKSNDSSKRKKESEAESSGFEAALMDMDLPLKKKKKKKSKVKGENDNEEKEKEKSIPLKQLSQPSNLDTDYGKNLPVLPPFNDDHDEPMPSQLMTHYRPLPQVPQRIISNDPFHSRMSEEEALNYMLSSRNNSRNRRIYTGKASGLSYVPSLYDCCIKVLQENIEALEITGGIPYDILKPVLERATPQQLFTLEDFNPYLLDDSDELWANHCRKCFKNKKKEDMESWRDMYIRCTDEQHHRMKVVTENLQKKYVTKAPQRKTTQLAYVDVAAKPPKNVARAQAKYGTGSSISPQKPLASSRSDDGGSQVIQRNLASISRPDRPLPQYKPPASKKTKVAPLMAKTRQLMKKVCRR